MKDVRLMVTLKTEMLHQLLNTSVSSKYPVGSVVEDAGSSIRSILDQSHFCSTDADPREHIILILLPCNDIVRTS